MPTRQYLHLECSEKNDINDTLSEILFNDHALKFIIHFFFLYCIYYYTLIVNTNQHFGSYTEHPLFCLFLLLWYRSTFISTDSIVHILI